MPNIVLLALKVVTVEFPGFLKPRQVETRSPSYSPWISDDSEGGGSWFELMSFLILEIAPQTREKISQQKKT